MVINDTDVTTDIAHVCGGTPDQQTPQKACYSYSATNDVWKTTGLLMTARYAHGMTIYNGRVSLR
jgi:hypothetical protein